jgi:hypothetical protein
MPDGQQKQNDINSVFPIDNYTQQCIILDIGEQKMNASNYEISSGYVGSFGKSYQTATDQSLAEAIESAAQFNQTTTDSIRNLLENGTSVNWCQSPNYYYDHSLGSIRMKRTRQSVKMVMCDCGHEVPAGQRMSASMGTSCPDCYDRMSD